MLLSQALYQHPIYCINNNIRCAKYKEELYLHRQDVGFLLDITKPYKDSKMVKWDKFYPIFEKCYPNSNLELIGFDSGVGSNLKASEIEAKVPEYIHIKIVLRMAFRMRSEYMDQFKDDIIDYLISSYLDKDRTFRMDNPIMNTIYTTHYSFYPESTNEYYRTVLNSAVDVLLRNMQCINPKLDLKTVWWKVIDKILNHDILGEDFQMVVEDSVEPLKKLKTVGGLFKNGKTEKAVLKRSRKPTLKHYIDCISSNEKYLVTTIIFIDCEIKNVQNRIKKKQPSNLFVYRISGTASIEAIINNGQVTEKICLHGDPYRSVTVFGKSYTELDLATEINNFPNYRYFTDDESKYRFSNLLGLNIKVYNREFEIEQIPVKYSLP